MNPVLADPVVTEDRLDLPVLMGPLVNVDQLASQAKMVDPGPAVRPE